jgi:hypothetical protein
MRGFLSDRELGELYRPTLIDEVSTLSLEESRMKRLVSGLTVLTRPGLVPGFQGP